MFSMLKIIPALLGCLGCALCQRYFLQASRAKDYRAAFFFKGAAGLCFVAVGVLAATECRSGAFAWRTVAGLLLGLLGDQLLAMRFLRPKQHDMFFALGGVAFALGHAVYIAAILSLGTFSLGLTAALMLAGLVLSGLYSRLRRPDAGRLQLPGMLYIALVVAMCAIACASAAAKANAGRIMFAVGAACFVVSDNILCAYCFGNKREQYMNSAIHLTYYAAQLLIGLSMAFV